MCPTKSGKFLETGFPDRCYVRPEQVARAFVTCEAQKRNVGEEEKRERDIDVIEKFPDGAEK